MLKRIVKFLIAIVFRGCEKIGALFQTPSNQPGTCVVLMYHAVTPRNFDRFVWQMEKMLQLATPVAADAIPSIANGQHYVAVTFDDGFAKTIELVLPVLAAKKIPATFFIPAACLEKDADWMDDKVIRNLVGRIISPERLALLAGQPAVIIGSHCSHHRPLPALTDSDAAEEINGSRTTLETITDKTIRLLCFPYGEYEDRHVAMALQAGYENVFTVDPTLARGGTKEFIIGRVEVDPTDWPLEFMLKLIGAYRWHPFVSRIKRLFF